MTLLHGIHHITAIASDPQATLDFYRQTLGLRLVKKTVNQDDVNTYHLFFGDKTGEPGMDLTFFTFQPVNQGQRGVGQVTCISLAVPETALPFWQQRLVDKKVKHEAVSQKWGKPCIVFYDQDGQCLELVGLPDTELPADHVWTTDEVSTAEAIRSFYSARLTVNHPSQIAPLLTHAFGYQSVETIGKVTLYQLPAAQRAAYLELEADETLPTGSPGAGTVHHIAFRVTNEAEQRKVVRLIRALGLDTTGVIDRFYFQSVYFRTPAGILCELATDGPGFTADEAESELGKELALPPFLEPHRAEIEAGLTPLLT